MLHIIDSVPQTRKSSSGYWNLGRLQKPDIGWMLLVMIRDVPMRWLRLSPLFLIFICSPVKHDLGCPHLDTALLWLPMLSAYKSETPITTR
jgi:hypothetical protein